ncbi:MAG: 4Fe-4S double cluster binding domain-containing protein [Anaerovorax sp.]
MNNQELNRLIYQTFDGLEKNNFATLGHPEMPMWERPLIGVSSGDDPYFDFLKDHIGTFHWKPIEVFRLKYDEEERGVPILEKNLRVVSMAFPQVMGTKEAQCEEKICPSKNWLVSRGEWEPLMKEFSGRLVGELEKRGISCVSIDLQPEFSRETSERMGIASKWSHRHGAYASGLGTFGLSDGFITEKGKAVRMTTLIVELPLTVKPRPYTTHHEWCLYFKDGSCGLCIDRCPVHAISEKGHDKERCAAYEEEVLEKYYPEDLDNSNYIFGCGLCQVDIPCQNKRP